MTRRQQRMVAVAMLAIGVSAAVALALTAFRKNLMSFYTPSDLLAAPLADGTRLRLGGLVERGSVQRGQGLLVRFTLADCSHSLPVQYEGILPDLFREGQGIVATGTMGTIGPDRAGPAGSPGTMVFVADEVLAKHDENYIPPQLAEALKTPAGHSCAPFKPVSSG